MNLSQQKCIPCEGGTPKMDSSEVQKHLNELSGWKLEDNKINKIFEYDDFISAMKFVNSVAVIAEKEGHHPDIHIFSYKKVEISLWTHAVNGLSFNDFILAAKIDEI